MTQQALTPESVVARVNLRAAFLPIGTQTPEQRKASQVYSAANRLLQLTRENMTDQTIRKLTTAARLKFVTEFKDVQVTNPLNGNKNNLEIVMQELDNDRGNADIRDEFISMLIHQADEQSDFGNIAHLSDTDLAVMTRFLQHDRSAGQLQDILKKGSQGNTPLAAALVDDRYTMLREFIAQTVNSQVDQQKLENALHTLESHEAYGRLQQIQTRYVESRLQIILQKNPDAAIVSDDDSHISFNYPDTALPNNQPNRFRLDVRTGAVIDSSGNVVDIQKFSGDLLELLTILQPPTDINNQLAQFGLNTQTVSDACERIGIDISNLPTCTPETLENIVFRLALIRAHDGDSLQGASTVARMFEEFLLPQQSLIRNFIERAVENTSNPEQSIDTLVSLFANRGINVTRDNLVHQLASLDLDDAQLQTSIDISNPQLSDVVTLIENLLKVQTLEDACRRAGIDMTDLEKFARERGILQDGESINTLQNIVLNNQSPEEDQLRDLVPLLRQLYADGGLTGRYESSTFKEGVLDHIEKAVNQFRSDLRLLLAQAVTSNKEKTLLYENLKNELKKRGIYMGNDLLITRVSNIIDPQQSNAFLVALKTEISSNNPSTLATRVATTIENHLQLETVSDIFNLIDIDQATQENIFKKARVNERTQATDLNITGHFSERQLRGLRTKIIKIFTSQESPQEKINRIIDLLKKEKEKTDRTREMIQAYDEALNKAEEEVNGYSYNFNTIRDGYFRPEYCPSVDVLAINNLSFYDFLGVSPNNYNDPTELKKALTSAVRRASLLFHPDTVGADQKMEKILKIITKMDHILQDDTQRESYDRFGYFRMLVETNQDTTAPQLFGRFFVIYDLVFHLNDIQLNSAIQRTSINTTNNANHDRYLLHYHYYRELENRRMSLDQITNFMYTTGFPLQGRL